jgi:hypothetical protein
MYKLIQFGYKIMVSVFNDVNVTGIDGKKDSKTVKGISVRWWS